MKTTDTDTRLKFRPGGVSLDDVAHAQLGKPDPPRYYRLKMAYGPLRCAVGTLEELAALLVREYGDIPWNWTTAARAAADMAGPDQVLRCAPANERTPFGPFELSVLHSECPEMEKEQGIRHLAGLLTDYHRDLCPQASDQEIESRVHRFLGIDRDRLAVEKRRQRELLTAAHLQARAIRANLQG